MKFPVLKKNYQFNEGPKILTSKHQSGWVVGWLEGSWGGWVCGVVGGGGVHGGLGGWRVNGVGAYTHPPMNSYNVKRFNFMNSHPPIKHIQSVTLLLYI